MSEPIGLTDLPAKMPNLLGEDDRRSRKNVRRITAARDQLPSRAVNINPGNRGEVGTTRLPGNMNIIGYRQNFTSLQLESTMWLHSG
ncbi:hypothetical protein A0H81_09511 [Grifola frondosa]|uniref:Uncharacterized protein n=1 Tax=Grifola frondosa TaxID=5627 RepID=A0A1C7M1X2_GRIFR|nr:hypothetical protein A0H81_09511 [Grifola frondosa]